MAWVSRTPRNNNKVGMVDMATKDIGPGSYSLSGSISKGRPSHAPFGTTDTRKFGSGRFVTPGPGTYSDQSTSNDSFGSGKGASMAFRSKTKRGQSGSSNFATPGPGAYVQHQEFVRKSKGIKKSQSQNEGVRWVRVPTAPSIPGINQSFGYEEGHNGQLIMQNPTHIGHTGRAGDSVGPGEYETEPSIRRNKRAINFGASKVRSTP